MSEHVFGAVFDLDGTLADTPAAISGLLRRVSDEFGRPRTEDEVRPTIGKPLEPAVAGLIDRPVDHADTTSAVARYRELFEREVLGRGPDLLFPGVTDGLHELRARGIGLAVGTSKITRSAEQLLTATNIRHLFHPVIGNDQVEHPKPHPDMGLRAAAELGLRPESCAYIGDTETDMRMASAAGLRPVAVTYGVAPAAALAAEPEVVLCHTFTDVVSTLLDLVYTPVATRG
ncbi:HAD family hydrolase [Actinokineospora enzanensis]|uniref:HAD family hydrolase n=1 Tax=Actinokineospora enzanensis TaxID=155975 RepID=UPI000368F053|nr:HAD family hydrolase [Actinokineospora enzanensis]